MIALQHLCRDLTIVSPDRAAGTHCRPTITHQGWSSHRATPPASAATVHNCTRTPSSPQPHCNSGATHVSSTMAMSRLTSTISSSSAYTHARMTARRLATCSSRSNQATTALNDQCCVPSHALYKGSSIDVLRSKRDCLLQGILDEGCCADADGGLPVVKYSPVHLCSEMWKNAHRVDVHDGLERGELHVAKHDGEELQHAVLQRAKHLQRSRAAMHSES